MTVSVETGGKIGALRRFSVGEGKGGNIPFITFEEKARKSREIDLRKAGREEHKEIRRQVAQLKKLGKRERKLRN